VQLLEYRVRFEAFLLPALVHVDVSHLSPGLEVRG